MKDLVKISAVKGQAATSDMLRAAAIHFTAALCGFAASRSVIASSLMPFGISCMAGVPVWLTPAATIGAFCGYFIPAIGSGGFRYITTLFAILAIKLLLSTYKKPEGITLGEMQRNATHVLRCVMDLKEL